MWKVLARVSIVITLIVISLMPQVAAAVPAAAPTLVAESDEWISGPISDGRYAVWSNSGAIYAADLETYVTTKIADGDLIVGANTWCTDAAIDDGVLAWSRPTGEIGAGDVPLYAIHVHNLATGDERVVTTSADAQCPVQIDDGRVTYRTNGATWLLDLNRAEPARPVWMDDNGWFIGMLDDWTIGLQDTGIFDQGFVYQRLLARQVYTSESRVLDEGWVHPDIPYLMGVIDDFVAYGTFAPDPESVPYVGGPAISVTNLDQSPPQSFSWGGQCPSPGIRVTGDDGYLVVSCHSLDESEGHDLWVTDLRTTSTFTVTLSPASPVTAVVVDGRLIWTELRDDRYMMFTMPWREALPSARQADPGVVRPEAAYFEETGHSIQLGFKGYWERHGGLPVFGYPLTEEYWEWNADSGQFHVTQYLERQRFEWHPENEGTPYQVLLGRLGYEHASRMELLTSEPFRYRGDDEGPDAGCLYSRETGHYVCDAFRFYWEEHGLDLGDPGISFRESLALFGYPLSEPFMMTNYDGDTVLTQYFERAVFEYHPDNSAEYQVLLRRLGEEVLVQRGW